MLQNFNVQNNKSSKAKSDEKYTSGIVLVTKCIDIIYDQVKPQV